MAQPRGFVMKRKELKEIHLWLEQDSRKYNLELKDQ
jgi:hypothetical protein